jgi:hypothetical protein
VAFTNGKAALSAVSTWFGSCVVWESLRPHAPSLNADARDEPREDVSDRHKAKAGDELAHVGHSLPVPAADCR